MKFGKINFLSKNKVRTNLHIYQYQKDYFQKKEVGIAKLVRKLLDEEIFRDMGGKNPTERLMEAKQEYEVAKLIYDEEKKQLDEIQKKFGSIQTILERYIEAYCRNPGSIEQDMPYKIITVDWGIPWEDFKKCAKNFSETGKMDLTIISKELINTVEGV